MSTYAKGDFTLESGISPNYSVTHDWGTNLLYLFDHGDPANPVLIDSTAITLHGPTLIVGNYLYVASSNSLSIFQIGDTQPLSVDPNGNFVTTPPSPEIWQTNGNTYFVDATKKIGIGTQFPDFALEIGSGSTDLGATLQLSNLDRSHFLRIFGGHTNDPNSWINWKQGNPLIFSTANSESTGWSEKMRIDFNGFVGIGEISPDNPFHVKGAGGQGVHIAKIENTNPNGSGLEIQINGNHSMLISAPNAFPLKVPLPLETVAQPIIENVVDALKARIESGQVLSPPTLQELIEVLETPNVSAANNIVKALGMDQLLKAALCDGQDALVQLLSLPEMDLSNVNLPNDLVNIPTLPTMSTASIDLPNFNNPVVSIPLPSVGFTQVSLEPIFPFSVVSGISIGTTNWNLNMPQLPNITIPAFGPFNTAINTANSGIGTVNSSLETLYDEFRALKTDIEYLQDANLIATDIFNCGNLTLNSAIQGITLPTPQEIVDEFNIRLDGNNHFVTFKDQHGNELGAIKAHSPEEWLISQLSTSNVLEIASIMVGLISDDGNIAENAINMFGMATDWAVGLNEIGVTYESSFGDYAEWLPRRHELEDITYGDIIGIRGGKISKDLTDAEQVMVVSKAPIVMGNAPHADSLHLGHNVAFIGQVPVKVMGPVKSGDYIVADRKLQGFGRAISPQDMTQEDFAYTVGKSWDTNDLPGFKYVNTLVGMHNNAWVSPMQKMQQRLQEMEQKQAQQDKILSQLIDRVDALSNPQLKTISQKQ